jgi:predicted phage terminase large subunit-like protein
LLFPVGDLKRFRKADIAKTDPTTIVAVGDIADEGSDSLCVPLGKVYGKDCYIPDVIFTQDTIEVTQPRTAALLDDNNVAKARFESNNGGKGYALEVKRIKQGSTTVTWKPTVSNKHTRIIMKSGFIKEHVYFLVDEEQDEEYRKYFYELTHYPKNGKVKHDDAADGTTMLGEFISRKSGWSVV